VKMRSLKFSFLIFIFIILELVSCGEKQQPGQEAAVVPGGTGIGPVSKVEIGPIDEALAGSGKKVFEMKCVACHKFEEKVVGPPLKDVTKRRAPEWIMNMILNPAEMTQKDPVAQELFATYLVQMTFQNITEKEAREVLEYFRQKDSK